MKDSLHTIIYSAVMGTVCALLLTGAATITKPYKESNARAEKNRSILGVLNADFPAEASAQELEEIFKANVQTEKRGDLEFYLYCPAEAQGQVKTVAVEFAGPGLWAPIKGFLALNPQMDKIVGIVFHEQEETPGLGGDIATKEFCDRFIDKTLVDASGKPGIIITTKALSATNEVAGISGATMTSDKVQAMLNIVIEKIVKERKGNG
ncbi:MAG: FMN-binding protein [Sedimentisphaerales bacterium]|nr:FMN-binding protein [Sedimentisphaerales bacterium]